MNARLLHYVGINIDRQTAVTTNSFIWIGVGIAWVLRDFRKYEFVDFDENLACVILI